MLFNKICNQEEKIAVIGLGYVGLPLAIAFSKKVKTIGFDLNKDKIMNYKSGIDPTGEVGNDEIRNSSIHFTNESNKLKEAKFHIVSVPTPIKVDKTPNLFPVENASKLIGENLSKGSIVVYESTVYPGVTEDVCIPILEKESGLKCGEDFQVGYSPERINPGDKVNTLEKIVKIVAGNNEKSTEEIAKVYEIIIEAGIHRASSIKVAEAAKVVENSQRDINIAFMNELAMVFNKMNINSNDVIEAMNTKWNALGFYPGLVGGHCISVDPYYFLYEAEKLGYHSQIVLSGRKINDGMGQFIADAIVKELILGNKVVKGSKVVILGITFKENCPDIRNSKVIDIIRRLWEYGVETEVIDPHADWYETKKEYGIELSSFEKIKNTDALAITVAHNEFKKMHLDDLETLFKNDDTDDAIIDIKGVLDKQSINKKGYRYWSL